MPTSPHTAPQYRIGQAAEHSGLSAASIRLYEREGLLPHNTRGDNTYRHYSRQDIHRLRFIRLCRAMDMSLEEVRTLLSLDLRRKEDCATATEAIDAHLGHVRERLHELQGLEQDLIALRGRCDGHGNQCLLIEALHERADQPDGRPLAKGHRHV